MLYLCALWALVYGCARSDKIYLIACIPIIAFIPFSHNMFESKELLFSWIMVAGLAEHRRSRMFEESLSAEMTTEIAPEHLMEGTKV